jgi:N-acetylmuramic acid 6-phosphate etherase
MMDPTSPQAELKLSAADFVSPTEERNAATEAIDTLPTETVVKLLQAESAQAITAVAAVAADVARLADLGIEAIRAGGHIHYAGGGTSGRLALLDAAELPPTYGVPADWFTAHLAGGDSAMLHSIEDAEDDQAQGGADLAEARAGDLVVGLSASGRTPYVAGALQQARQRGAKTGLISSNPQAPLAVLADVAVLPDTGPEPITGSTRMKAGTAAKLILNDFSTTVLVRLGRTYSNLMVDVVPANAKLRQRLVRLLCQATGLTQDQSSKALAAADGDVRVALVAFLGHVTPGQARAAIKASEGNVRSALVWIQNQ